MFRQVLLRPCRKYNRLPELLKAKERNVENLEKYLSFEEISEDKEQKRIKRDTIRWLKGKCQGEVACWRISRNLQPKVRQPDSSARN